MPSKCCSRAVGAEVSSDGGVAGRADDGEFDAGPSQGAKGLTRAGGEGCFELAKVSAPGPHRRIGAVLGHLEAPDVVRQGQTPSPPELVEGELGQAGPPLTDQAARLAGPLNVVHESPVPVEQDEFRDLRSSHGPGRGTR